LAVKLFNGCQTCYWLSNILLAENFSETGGQCFPDIRLALDSRMLIYFNADYFSAAVHQYSATGAKSFKSTVITSRLVAKTTLIFLPSGGGRYFPRELGYIFIKGLKLLESIILLWWLKSIYLAGQSYSSAKPNLLCMNKFINEQT
jgi:hypothetical protein